MKKTLLAVLCVLSAISFAFVGCQQDSYDVTGTITDSSLPGPANFKADPDANLQGAIRLTWDPVIDAKGYEIWRKTGSEAYAKLANPSASQGEYFDYISTDNLLQNSTTYSYLIVALSDKSSAGNGRAVADIVQNGKSETSFKTRADQFPALGTPIADIGEITLTQVGTTVYAQWAANPNKAVSYIVTTYDDQGNSSSAWTNNGAFPFSYWNQAVSVQPTFDNSYYAPGKIVSKTVDTTARWNGVWASLSVDRDERDSVKITYYKIDNAKDYAIYRAEDKPKEYLVWTKLTLAAPILNQNEQYVTYDTAAEDKDWQYRLVVTAEDGSIAVSSVVSVSKDSVRQVKALNLQVTTVSTDAPTPSADYDDRTWKIHITYETEDGATYKLYRQKYGNADGTVDYNDPNYIGNWVEFTNGTKTTGYNSETITIDNPELRQKYNYKVIGTKDGYKAREQYYNQVSPLAEVSFDYAYRVATSYTTTGTGTVASGYVYNFSFYGLSYLYTSNGGVSRPVSGEKIVLYGKDRVTQRWIKITEWTKPDASYSYTDWGNTTATTVTAPGYYYTFPATSSGYASPYNDYKAVLESPK